MGSRRHLTLHSNWQFREDDAASPFRDTQGFPTDIYLDLMHHGLIEDPFRGKNELKVQWVGETSWIYKTTFNTPFIEMNEKAVMCFEGLDTFATVYLNAKVVLKTSNMFLPEQVDVCDLLRPHGGCNNLVIVFESAWLKGKDLVRRYPDHKWICSNGHPNRLAVRKAQYHYGWDWGPRLMTCGPWRPIYLDVFSSRILEIKTIPKVAEDLSSADIEIRTVIEGSADQVQFYVALGEQRIGQDIVTVNSGSAKASFRAQNPKLWYPRRYGDQPLYTIEVVLLDKCGTVLDKDQRKIGLRRAKVLQEKLANTNGTSFVVEINNVPIFCGGSNWIPADSFVSRMTTAKFRKWIKMLADGNQTMIRIWGGGVWESDALYDACDELGILVWQDFMFACGNYPAYDEFLESIKSEAAANIKRLHTHPCIVIWAGNNEDYQIAESEGLNYDRNDTNAENWLQSDFPARYIYEKVLKDTMAENAPGAFYHFGSPFGGKSSGDPSVGDIHQWNVWHGTQEPYQKWDKLAGRFVSEFGMQGLPDMKTVDHFFYEGDVRERYPESSTTSFHNKAVGHDRRLGLYLTENLCYRFQPFDQYAYYTQVMQADCLSSAFRSWKRQWKGPGKRYCAGALVWQANDCWPCTSWAIVDYYLRPKLAYFAVKREMDTLTLGMKRVVSEEEHQKANQIELWICNLTVEAKELEICIETFNCDRGTREQHADLTWHIKALPNRTTEIASFELPCADMADDTPNQTIVIGSFKCQQLHGFALNWPDPLKFVHVPRPNMNINITEPFELLRGMNSDHESFKGASRQTRWLQIVSDAPVKSLFIELCDVDDGRNITLEDNGVDIAPYRWVTVQVNGCPHLERLKVRWRYLGSDFGGFQQLQVVDQLFTNAWPMGMASVVSEMQRVALA